jgi:hypothetical protein
MSEHGKIKSGKKTAPPPRPAMPPIIDTKTAQEMQDEEFARAIQESINQEAYNAHHNDGGNGGNDDNGNDDNGNDDNGNDIVGAWGYDLDMEELRKHQMEMDEEIARQLMEEFNRERNSPDISRQVAAMPGNRRDNRQGNRQGNDDDDIIKQAPKGLKRTENAYNAPINLDRLMEEQDNEDERIRQQYEARFKQDEARKLREEQDAEYEALLAASLAAEADQFPAIPAIPPIPNIPDTIMDSSSSDSEEVEKPDELEPVQPTPDELRRARLAYFMKQK